MADRDFEKQLLELRRRWEAAVRGQATMAKRVLELEADLAEEREVRWSLSAELLWKHLGMGEWKWLPTMEDVAAAIKEHFGLNSATNLQASAVLEMEQQRREAENERIQELVREVQALRSTIHGLNRIIEERDIAASKKASDLEQELIRECNHRDERIAELEERIVIEQRDLQESRKVSQCWFEKHLAAERRIAELEHHVARLESTHDDAHSNGMRYGLRCLVRKFGVGVKGLGMPTLEETEAMIRQHFEQQRQDALEELEHKHQLRTSRLRKAVVELEQQRGEPVGWVEMGELFDHCQPTITGAGMERLKTRKQRRVMLYACPPEQQIGQPVGWVSLMEGEFWWCHDDAVSAAQCGMDVYEAHRGKQMVRGKR